MIVSTRGSRLDSWKEIAVYLGRTVRTVQRWEESEGLPVHRHQHHLQGTVYAYPEELDAWVANRRLPTNGAQIEVVPEAPLSNGAEAEEAPKVPPSNIAKAEEPLNAPRSKRALWVGTAAAAGIAILAVSWWAVSLARPSRSVWLLVTDLDNRTGEPLLDGSVPFLLEREIAGSSTVYVAPRDRVEDALRLMRRDPVSKVDEALGREICLRDGDLRLVLSCRAVRVSTGYLLTASVVDSISGRLLGARTEPVANLDGVAAAVRRLAAAVRRAAGESADLTPLEKLPHVATPSLRACQLFSHAYEESTRRNWPLCEQFAREALALDPQFASAHLWLHWALRNQGKVKEARSQLEQAVSLKNTATDRERQFILLSQKTTEGKWQEVEVAARRMLASYPDDYFAHMHLASALVNMGRLREAKHERLLAADLRPNEPLVQEDAMSSARPDLSLMRKYAARLTQIFQADPGSFSPDTARFLAGFALHELWLGGRLDELHNKLQARTAIEKNEIERVITIGFYFTLGKLREAEAVSGQLPSPWREETAVRIAYLRDDPDGLMNALPKDRKACEAILQKTIGVGPLLWIQPSTNPGEISAFISGLAPADHLYRGVLESRIAALRGDLATAIQRINSVQRVDRAVHFWQVTQTHLARTTELKGDPRAALGILENADDGPVSTYYGNSASAYWHRNRYERARYLYNLGRVREAAEIEESLRRDLRIADPDHPILIRLRENQRRPFQLY
jgi:tetratricopeptide (TPR) repeat protein